MKRLLIQYSWILGIAAGLFLLLALTGCNQPPFTQGPIYDATEESTTHTDTGKEQSGVPNFSGIARALGCVFAPDSCKQ